MKRLSLRIGLRKAEYKRPKGIAKGNGRYDNYVARRERFRDVITKRVLALRGLDERVGEGEGLPVIDLVDVLYVLVHCQATDIVQGHAELKGAVRSPIDGNVKSIVTDEDVHLERVPWGRAKKM